MKDHDLTNESHHLKLERKSTTSFTVFVIIAFTYDKAFIAGLPPLIPSTNTDDLPTNGVCVRLSSMKPRNNPNAISNKMTWHDSNTITIKKDVIIK